VLVASTIIATPPAIDAAGGSISSQGQGSLYQGRGSEDGALVFGEAVFARGGVMVFAGELMAK
jgi:hypothetical protein